MNSSNQLRVVGQDGVLTKKILTEKQFSFNGLDWHYENNFHLSITTEEYSSKVKIKNHLCEMQGNTIKKVTEIIHKNKKYTIQDNYSIHLPPGTSEGINKETKDAASTNDSDNKNEFKDKSEDKKLYIFKKVKKNKFINDQQPTEHLRNTKNITKNFCKAFLTYLKSDKIVGVQRAIIKEGIHSYSKLLECKKYNNKLIKKIISTEILRDLFQMFLEKEAKHWISESRVNDKTLHQEAISIYLNLFESMHLPHKDYSSESSPSDEDKPDSEKESE